MADDSPSIRLFGAISRRPAGQGVGDADDFEALRRFVAADLVIEGREPVDRRALAVMHQGADAVITRLQAPINKATSLTTENINVQQAGDDVSSNSCPRSSRRRHSRQHGLPHLHGGRWSHHRHAGLPQRARDPRGLRRPSAHTAIGRADERSGRLGPGYRLDMLRTAAVAVSAMAGVGAVLCFMHFPSVTIDGRDQQCRGVTLFGQMASELGEVDDVSWRPLGCEEEYHRWMFYAGGLGLLSAFAGTGAAFYRREDEVAEEPARG